MTLLSFRPAVVPLRISETVLQLGADPTHRIDAPHAWQRSLIDALRSGIRADAIELTAFAAGAAPQEAKRMLRALAPVLHERDPFALARVRTEAIGAHNDVFEQRVRAALESSEAQLVPSDEVTATTILVVTGAIAPMHCARFMRDDRAFLPLAFELGGVRVGPLVQPGITPCIACRDLTLTDEDNQWPALQAKLIGRHPQQASVEPTHLAVEAALEVLRGGADHAAGRWAIVTNGRRTIWRQTGFHELCGCQRP